MTAPALALAPLSLYRPPSLDLVRAAAGAGYRQVGLRFALPGGAVAPECSDARLLGVVRAAIEDLGLGVLEVSTVELVPHFDLDGPRRVVDAAAALGAAYLQVTDWDPVPSRAAENLGRLCDLAAEVGLQVALEFMSYSYARDLEEARRLLSGLDRHKVGIILDVLHFVRSGGVAEQLRAGSNADLAFVQLCDGRSEAPSPDRLRVEAVSERLPPGEGALPLTEILAAISPVPTISVEAPCQALADRPTAEQAEALFTATSAFLERGMAQGAFHLGV